MADRTRLAGVLLILFALMTVAAPFLPSHADYDASSPAEDIAAFFEEDQALQTLQVWLHAGPVLLLLTAVVLLAPRLREAGPRGPALGLTAVAAAVAIAAVTVVGYIIVIVAMRSSNDGFDAHTALLLYNTGWIVMVFSPSFLLPFLAIPVGLLAREAGFPRFLKPVSLTLGALPVIAVAAAATPRGGEAAFVGMPLILLWALVFGVALVVRGAGAPAPRAAPT